MNYHFWVIEETTSAGRIALVRKQRELGGIVFFDTKKEAENWKNVLTGARGDISKFRIIKLQCEEGTE